MSTETVTPTEIAFEIQFAIGQTGAQTFINCHSKSPEVRRKAIDFLVQRIAVRFDDMTVAREVPDYQGPLFGSGVSTRPKPHSEADE